MSYKKVILTSVCEDIYKATKILGGVDFEINYLKDASNYNAIIKSCEQILLATAEEIWKEVVKEDEEEQAHGITDEC